MSFTSYPFWIFFALVLALYLPASQSRQNRLLLAASYFFYGMWDWRFIPILAFSTWISFWSALKIDAATDGARKSRYLCFALIVELGLLGVFKYFNFFIENAVALFDSLGAHVSPLAFKVILPLGISYYTFQAAAYSVDVYRGKFSATRNFLDFALFKSFFPILFGGPIERASNLLVQIGRKRSVDSSAAGRAVYLVLWGLFKKVWIADQLAPVVDRLFGQYAGLSGCETWIAAYAFTIQIYCDFSGYTDIARGLAKFMGFDLCQNFNLPFLAVNPLDFWRRFHISLTSWYRDYLSPWIFFRTKSVYVTLFVTFFLNGIWHGAAWNFVALGVYNGLILVAYVAIRPLFRAAPNRAASILATFHLNCIGFLIFRSESLRQAASLLSHLIFRSYAVTDLARWAGLKIVLLAAPLAAMQFLQAKNGDLEAFLRLPPRIRFAASLGVTYLVILIYLFTSDRSVGGGFIYFQF